MKFFLILFIIFTSQCANKKFSYYSSNPPTLTNSDIRITEIKRIKKGDKILKAKAVLGESTTKFETQDGVLLEWYLAPTNYQKDSYKTLSKKPNSEELYFIKIKGDSKGFITDIEFKL